MLKKLFVFLTRPLVGSGLGWSQPLWEIYCYLCKFLARPGETVDVHGFKMLTKTCGDLPTIVVSGEYEEFNTKIFSKFINKDTVVVDIGAHVGYYSLLSASMGAKVYAFEPEKQHLNYLTENIKLNKFNNITVLDMAVSDHVSMETLYASRYHGAGYTLYSGDKDTSSVSVKVTSLDDYFKHTDIKVDLIKIDIEGMEPRALQGMVGVVSGNDSIKILMEFSIAYLQKAGSSPEELWGILTNMGFSHVYFLDDKQGIIRLYSLEDAVKYRKRGVFGRDVGASLFCSKKEIDFRGS